MNEHNSDAPGADVALHAPCPSIAPGIADFTFLRRQQKYYVDKTRQLAALLENNSGPLLLTRPRRFGKTLTLDTLRCFLELDYEHPGETARQQELFEGLAIMEDPALRECRELFMGQHPVISITFNNVEGRNFAQALLKVRDAVAPLYEAAAFRPVLEAAGACLDEDARLILRRYYRLGSLRDPDELEELLPMALPRLCQALHHLYGRSVYVLIDEYDTPLAKAWSAELASPRSHAAEGYYARMASLMRGVLQPLLKPQPVMQGSIARCILTGCTRVSRESLFSGANNLSVLDCNDSSTATLMGFTEEEVQALLASCGLKRRMSAVRRWYDGYRFAGVRIYNPWSISKFCQAAMSCPGLRPGNYWIHTSAHVELSACLHAMSGDDLERLQQLCLGKKTVLPIINELSYEELLARGDGAGLFTLLYHGGYLTRDNAPTSAQWRMRLPNAEVRDCLEQQILSLYDFRGEAQAGRSNALIAALLEGRGEGVRLALNELFARYLSFHARSLRSSLAEQIAQLLQQEHPELAADFRAFDDRRPERVYQLYVMGVLSGHVGRSVQELVLERELGEGRCDLSFMSAGDGPTGCVLEFKKAADVAPGGDDYPQRLQAQCRRAAREGLDQIESRGYAAALLQLHPRLQEVQAYGIGCAGKRCAVEWRRYGRENLQD